MRISDWSSDVCSSDLACGHQIDFGIGVEVAEVKCAVVHIDLVEADRQQPFQPLAPVHALAGLGIALGAAVDDIQFRVPELDLGDDAAMQQLTPADRQFDARCIEQRHRYRAVARSEEHTSELQSLMRISYAVFC